MATHGKIGEFDPIQESWDMYIERLELYFVANGVTEAERKRAVLLTASGPSTYKLIRNLTAPEKPTEVAYSEIVALVKVHHTPKPSVTVQRYKFHTRTQQPGESVAVFVAELRQLSEHCEFGTTLEDMIRDRLVCGVANSSIQGRLLAEQSLTLKQAHDLARAIETAEKNVRDLQGPKQSTAVHTVMHKQRGAEHRTGTENPCHQCGGKHLPQQCRFKTNVCHACKKRGHLARMCRTKKSQAGVGRNGQGQGIKPQRTHLLEGGEKEPHTAESYTLFPVQSQRVSPIQVKMRVKSVEIVMELDTGAALSVISEQTYWRMWPHGAPDLGPSNVSLHTYTGEHAAGSAGKFSHTSGIQGPA